MMSDGTNSKVFYTANVCAKPPVWVEGAAVAGVYTAIRPSSTPGSVEIYAPASDAVTTEYDFTVSDHGFTVDFLGTYSAGVGWITTQGQGIPDPANSYRGVGISKSISSTTLLGYILDYTITLGSYTPGHDTANFIADDTATLQIQQQPGFGAGTHQFNWTGSHPSTTSISTGIYCGVLDGSSSDPGGTVIITKITLIASATGGDANVRLSTDYGATFGSAVTVGTSPGSEGGFDLNYIGAASLAAAQEQVKKATTLGGAYSNEANGALVGGVPVLLLITWYEFGSTTTTQFNSSSPQYLLGSSVEVSSNALWRVTGSGQTDVTPAASAVCIGPFSAMTWKGTKAAILMDVSGTRHLYSTLNLGGSPPTWTDRSTAVSGALYCRGRRKSKDGKQLYICGGTILKYSATQGANLYNRTAPTSDQLKGVEIVG